MVGIPGSDESKRRSDMQPFGLRAEEGEAPSFTSRTKRHRSSDAHSGSEPHTKKVRFEQPQKNLGPVLNRRVDEFLQRHDVNGAANGAPTMSLRGRRNFKQFVASLPSRDDQEAFLTHMETLANAGSHETIEDIFKRTTTNISASDEMDVSEDGLPAAPIPAIPGAATAASPLVTPPPASNPAATNPASSTTAPNAAAAANNKPAHSSPKAHLHHHHSCNLGVWLAASLVAYEINAVTQAATGIAKNILTELNSAHGAKGLNSTGQFTLLIEMFDIASSVLKMLPSALSVATHQKLMEVAKECNKDGHITDKDRKQIVDDICMPAIKAASPQAHGAIKIDHGADDKAAKAAQQARLNALETESIYASNFGDNMSGPSSFSPG